MNTTQIKCFLAVAETLNFTKAAESLYMSQPNLSYQISSMERELNTQLFIRDQKAVHLTPAATYLAQELKGVCKALEQIVARAKAIGMGYSGSLTIGVLEGQWMGETFAGCCRRFITDHPNIDFRIVQGTFESLRRDLSRGEIDVAVTLNFNVQRLDGVISQLLEHDNSVLAVSRQLPIAQKETITVNDIMEETFLIIAPEENRMGTDVFQQFVTFLGQQPDRIRHAPNLSTLMLWVEAGCGIGAISYHSSLSHNPRIRLITELPLLPGEEMSVVAAWREDTSNPAVELFRKALPKS